MMKNHVLNILVNLDFSLLNQDAERYEIRNKQLKVPQENNHVTLHMFNVNISELHTEVEYDFGRARGYKDAIERLIDATLKGNYAGKNESERRAASYYYCRNYPNPFTIGETVDLFDMEYAIRHYYNMLDATLKVLHAKSSARITSNSLLNIERSLTTN